MISLGAGRSSRPLAPTVPPAWTLLLVASGCAGGDPVVRVAELDVAHEVRGAFSGSEPLQTNWVLQPAGGVVVALHRRHLTVLDTLGTPVMRFGREGAGPGEFLAMGQVGTVADSVWINDSQTGRLTVVHPATGGYRTVPSLGLSGRPRNAPIEWSGGTRGVLPDGKLMLGGRHGPRERESITTALAIAGSNDSVDRVLITMVQAFECLLPNGGRPVVIFACQRELLMVAPDGHSATVLRRDADLPAGMAIRATRVAVTGDTVLDTVMAFPARAMTRPLLDSLAGAIATALDMPVSTDNWDPPDRFGPVLYGHQGNDGTLWLASVLTPRGHRWYLVTPEGALAGEFFLDPGLTIGAVSRDGAWAVRDLEDGSAELVRIRIGPVPRNEQDPPR